MKRTFVTAGCGRNSMPSEMCVPRSTRPWVYMAEFCTLGFSMSCSGARNLGPSVMEVRIVFMCPVYYTSPNFVCSVVLNKGAYIFGTKDHGPTKLQFWIGIQMFDFSSLKNLWSIDEKLVSMYVVTMFVLYTLNWLVLNWIFLSLVQWNHSTIFVSPAKHSGT